MSRCLVERKTAVSNDMLLIRKTVVVSNVMLPIRQIESSKQCHVAYSISRNSNGKANKDASYANT